MRSEIQILLSDCADMLDHLKQIASFEDEAEAELLIARIGEAMKPQAPPVSATQTTDLMDAFRSINEVYLAGFKAGKRL